MKRRNAKRHPSKTKNTRKHEMTKTRKKDKKALAKCEKQARKDETTEGTEIIEIGEADSLRSSSDSSLLKKLRFASSFPLCIRCWSRFAQPMFRISPHATRSVLRAKRGEVRFLLFYSFFCVYHCSSLVSFFVRWTLRVTQWFISFVF